MPYSELCLGSTKAGRGCSGEQACCSALPAAQMQSLQCAAACGVPALCSAPGVLLWALPELQLHWEEWPGHSLCQCREAEGSAGQNPFCLQPSPLNWPHVTSPGLVAKWCFLRRPRELQERVAGQCCSALLCLPSELGS